MTHVAAVVAPSQTNTEERRFFVSSVFEYAQKHALNIRSYSYDWIIEIEKGGVVYPIIGYDVGLNTSTVHQIARDKSACATLLSAHNVPCIPHTIFFKQGTAYSYNEATDAELERIFSIYNKDVVVKPNKGAGGIDVVRIQSMDALRIETQRLFAGHRTIAVSPYMESVCEYRVTILDGAGIHVYKKVRTPGSTEFRFNLAHGAKPGTMDTEEREHVFKIATDAAAAIGARFVNVDILETHSGLRVVEINGTVAFEKFVQFDAQNSFTAYTVYEQALDKLTGTV